MTRLLLFFEFYFSLSLITRLSIINGVDVLRRIVSFLFILFSLSSLQLNAGNLFNEISAREEINIGVGYMVPPMNYIDDDGVHTGFDVDLALAIAKHMGKTANLVKVNNKTRVSFLVTGKVDIVISSMNHTVGRDKVIDFSDVYLYDGKRILAKRGRFSSLQDFVGKRVAVVQGSNARTALHEKLIELGDPNPQILSFQSNAECLLALKTNKVDGYTNDTVILLGTSGGDSQYEAVGEIFSPTFFSIGVPENQSKLRDEVNFILRDMHLSGEWRAIYDKWFGPSSQYSLPGEPKLPPIWPM